MLKEAAENITCKTDLRRVRKSDKLSTVEIRKIKENPIKIIR